MAKNNKNKPGSASIGSSPTEPLGDDPESGENAAHQMVDATTLDASTQNATLTAKQPAPEEVNDNPPPLPEADDNTNSLADIAPAPSAPATVLEQMLPGPGGEPEFPNTEAPAPPQCVADELAEGESPLKADAEKLRASFMSGALDPARNVHAEKAGRENRRLQAQAIMARVQQEADSLSPELRKHLGAHVLANRLHDLNEKCFNEIQNFKSVSLTFYTLRANSKAFLSLRPDQMAIWSEGSDGNNLVGLGFGTSTAPALYLRNFLINAREMFLETYQDCSEIVLTLYVRTNQKQIKGRIDLPPGASITLQSRCDRCNIIGLSSFALDLE